MGLSYEHIVSSSYGKVNIERKAVIILAKDYFGLTFKEITILLAARSYQSVYLAYHRSRSAKQREVRRMVRKMIEYVKERGSC